MTSTGPRIDTLELAPLAEIYSEGRLRRVDRAYVEGLAASIREHGLDTPVQISPAPPKEAKRTGCRYLLAAGKHRIEAVRLLGWTEIPAIIGDRNALQIRLTEIDENLIRRELTAWDRAVFLVERQAIYETMHPETRKGAKGREVIDDPQTAKLAVWASAFSEDAAERMGMGRRTIERAVSIARRMAPEIRDLIPDLPISDNQVELEALAKRAPAEQMRIVEALGRAERPASSVRSAIAEIEGRPVEWPNLHDAMFKALREAWARAPMKVRRLFLDWLRQHGQMEGGA